MGLPEFKKNGSQNFINHFHALGVKKCKQQIIISNENLKLQMRTCLEINICIKYLKIGEQSCKAINRTSSLLYMLYIIFYKVDLCNASTIISTM